MPNGGVVTKFSSSNGAGKLKNRLTKLGFGHLKEKLFRLGDGKVAEKLSRMGDEKLVEKLNKLVESRVLEKLEKLDDQKLVEKISQIKSKKASEKSKSRNQSTPKEPTSEGSNNVEMDADKLFVRTGLSGKSRVSHYSNFSLDKITQFLEKQNEILLHKSEEKEEQHRSRRLSESDCNISLKKKPITPARVKDDDTDSEEEILDQDVVNILMESRERKGIRQKHQYSIRNEEPTTSERRKDKDSRDKHHKQKKKQFVRPSNDTSEEDVPEVKPPPPPPKPKVKKLKRRHIRPPAEPLLGFSDILKLAQEKVKEPVKTPIIKPKAKVPDRPLTQEEKDRLQRKQIRNNEKYFEGKQEQRDSGSKANKMDNCRSDRNSDSSFQKRNGQLKSSSAKEIQKREESKFIDRTQSQGRSDRHNMDKNKTKTSNQERPKSSISEKTIGQTKTSSSVRSSVPSSHVQTKSSESSFNKKPKSSFPEKSHHQQNKSSSSFHQKFGKLATSDSNKKPRLSLPEKSHQEVNRHSTSTKTHNDKQRLSLPTKQTIGDKSISRSVSSKHEQSLEKGSKSGFNSNRSVSGQNSSKSTMLSKKNGRNGSNSPVVYHGENENVLVCGPGKKSSRQPESPAPEPTNPFDRIYSQIKKNQPQASMYLFLFLLSMNN